MDKVTIAAQCRGVDVPASPFLTETHLRQMSEGHYEGDKIAGALAVVRPGDRVLELGAGLGVVSAVIARSAAPARVLSFEANPALVPHIRALHALNGLENRIELRNQMLTSGPDRPGVASGAALDEVLRAFRPDVLIVDIESGTPEFLEHARLHGIRAVVIRFHPGVYGEDGAKTCKDRLRTLGFQTDERVSTRLVWTCTRMIVRMEPPSPAGGWSCQIARLKRPVVVPPVQRSHIQPSGVLTGMGQAVPHGGC